MLSYIKLGIIALVILLSFGAGVKVESWHYQSSELKTEKGILKDTVNDQKIATGISANVDSFLTSLNDLYTKEIANEKPSTIDNVPLPAEWVRGLDTIPAETRSSS